MNGFELYISTVPKISRKDSRLIFINAFFQTKVSKIQKIWFYQISSIYATFLDEKSLQERSLWFAYLFSTKTSINYGLGTNHSFTKTIFLWPVLQKIHVMWGHVSVAAAWWLIIKNIVNYVIKHSLNYFDHERGKIKETKKVWHQFPFICGNCTK